MNDEWRSFRRGDKISVGGRTIPAHWFDLGKIKNVIGEPCFKYLSKLFVNLPVLPHSSASVERVFSHVNCVKTRATNRLTVESVRNRLLAKQAATKHGQNCSKWQASPSIVSDIVDGSCNKRYRKRCEVHRQENSVTVRVFNENDPPQPSH